MSALSQSAPHQMESNLSPLRAFSDFMAALFVEEEEGGDSDDAPASDDAHKKQNDTNRKEELFDRFKSLPVCTDLQASSRQTSRAASGHV